MPFVTALVVVCHLLPVSRSGDGTPDRPYEFKVGEEVVSNKGVVTAPSPAKQFTLPIDGGEIEHLYAAACGESTEYLYELNDHENGWSVIAGVERGGKILYRTEFGGFNLAQPALEGTFAYVATIGSIGKLDLSTGQLAWSHKDLLQHDSSFNVFEEAVIGPSEVVFRAKTSPGAAGFAKVVVDKASGKIKEFSHGG